MRTPAPYSHALVIGKCLPPHRGHLALVRFARTWASRVTVLVEQRPDEAVPVDTRARWLAEAVADPAVSVQPLYGDHPQRPPDDPAAVPGFWRYWQQLLHRQAGAVDAVVSGDDYGARLAQDLGAAWVPFDRSVLPISATLVKADPWRQWDWLIAPAQHALLRRLVVVGAESTGKTTLAQHLARTASPATVAIPEYAAHWLARVPTPAFHGKHWDMFAHGQEATRAVWAPHADRWVVEDSHALTTAVWAQQLGYPDEATRLFDRARRDAPHAVFLAASAGAPWVPEVHRSRPHDRENFEAAFRARLDEWGWAHTVLEGGWADRTHRAEGARDRFLDRWRSASWTHYAAPPIPSKRST